jgi:hypothetical protein
MELADKVGRLFFSEEKKQKTFFSLVRASPAGYANQKKVQARL